MLTFSWVLRVCCWKVGPWHAIRLLLRIYMGSRGVTKFLIKLIVKKASQRSQGFFCSKPLVLAGVLTSKLLAWSRICLNHQTNRIESCWSLVFHYIQTGLSHTPPPRIYKNLLNLWFSTMICRWLPGHCWSLRSGVISVRDRTKLTKQNCCAFGEVFSGMKTEGSKDDCLTGSK